MPRPAQLPRPSHRSLLEPWQIATAAMLDEILDDAQAVALLAGGIR
jgi:hypothetical protein